MSGPSTSKAGFFALVSRHHRRTYCSDQQRAPGAHTGLGRGGGLLGISLGLAPRGLPRRGIREKVPGYRGTVCERQEQSTVTRTGTSHATKRGEKKRET